MTRKKAEAGSGMSTATSSRRTTPVARHRKPAVVVAEPAFPETTPQVAATEDIARLAYALWEQRGCPVGSPEEDWLRAEEQLLARYSSASA